MLARWQRSAGTGERDVGRALDTVTELVSRLEAMLEHTTDMITVVAGDGSIRYSNKAAGVLTGHDESVNGTSAFSLIHPDDQGDAAAALLRCLESPGREERTEFRLRYRDGTWHHVDAYAKNCIDDAVAGVVVSMRDITERKVAEDALVATNEAMRDFVAVASHELRTPTSVINGFAVTMESRWDDLDDVSKRRFVGAIARSATRLSRLIDDLLIVSRIDAGIDEKEPGAAGVAEVVADALEDLGAEAEGVQVTVAPDLLVDIDAHRLARIVRNYVENALRYGSPPVLVEAAVEQGAVVLRVLDRGDGVPRDLEERLFERFARADRGDSREKGGTGLGLSIVRGLARAADGDAWHERRDGGGSCFAGRLPCPPPV